MRHRNYLCITFNACLAHDVGLKLPKFAKATLLWTFVTKNISDCIPSSGERDFARSRRYHARESWRELGSKRYLTVATIGKRVGLFVDDLLRRFCAGEFCRLQNRGIELDRKAHVGT